MDKTDGYCTICGKSKSGQAGQSLTQWIFNSETCRCDSAQQFLTKQDLCPNCGRTRGVTRLATMTQWIFHPELCSCGFVGSADAGSDPATTADTAPGSAFIHELEEGPINYHGLQPDSFPFDRFRIMAERGRGSGGVVYEAWDCLLKRRVAIKTMYVTFVSAEDVIRLQNEAKASSRLTHPAIIRILDFGAAPNGQPYLVSDFIDGATLKDRIDQGGPLPMRETISIFSKVCAGIAHAHEQGVLHRDLKSSNVMIADDGIRVIDFGVARLREAMSNTTSIKDSDTIVGTPFYMSPEQADGGKFDQRSEIYSIGCMMFETLTGRAPFEGDSALATMALHCNEPVPALADVNPDVDCSGDLEATIMRCLEKEPDERYQSVTALHNRLRQLSGEPIDGVYESDNAEALSETKATPSGRFLAIAGGAALVSTIGLISWFVMSSHKPDETTMLAPVSQRLPSQPSTPGTRGPDEKWDDDSIFGINPWVKVGHTSFTGSMWLKDRDFKLLNKEKEVTFVDCPLSEDITGAGIADISHFHIRTLHLVSKRLTDEGFSNIRKLNLLEYLTIGGATKLTQPSFDLLTTFPLLKVVRIIGLKHPANLLDTFSKIPDLNYLILMDSPSDNDSTDWSYLANMKKLRMLAILNYDFKNADLQYVCSLRQLKGLRLSVLGLNDFDSAQLKVLPLQYLDLSYNNISDKTLAGLASIKSLKEVDVSGCKTVTASGIKALKKRNINVLRQGKLETVRLDWTEVKLTERAARLVDKPGH